MRCTVHVCSWCGIRVSVWEGVNSGSKYHVEASKLMVTFCTTKFNIQKFCFLPTQYIYVSFFVAVRINSDYLLVQRELLVFTAETECVYCAVRTES